MVQKALDTGKRSIMHRKYEMGISSERMTGEEELHDAPMKLNPVITNICISLLVVALLTVCFHF